MAFSESPRFPDTISQGAVGGPEYKTLITSNDGGFEQRLGRWSFPLNSYDVAHGLKDQADLDVLYAFFRNSQGMLTGFRFKDWSDYNVIISNSNMAYSGLGVYQLGKAYVSGASSTIRDIKKVVDATYAIYRDAVLVTEGGGAGQYSLDITTGIFTINSDVFASCQGATNANPCVITDSGHGRTTGDELDLSLFNGITELNGQLVTITVLTANTFELDGVDSTAYGTYTSGGQWDKYIQSSEAVTWGGEFDVPVRFGQDQMQITIESFNNFRWGQIPLVELR